MAEGGSGVNWSLNFVEPVIAFLTGLFFGYQIWAKNQPIDSDFEDEEVNINIKLKPNAILFFSSGRLMKMKTMVNWI